MHTNLMCMEKNDYIKFVNISRHYAHKKLEDCVVFNKPDKTTEIYREKIINGIQCVIFGWNGKSMSAIDAEHDLYGMDLQKEKVKNGYILMEFEDRMLVKFVCVENAFLIKKYSDVGLRKVKTDKKDAIKLAKYCSDKWNELKAYSMQDSVYENLRFLSRQYSQQMALKVKAKVQFSNLLVVTFPNFNTVFSSDSQFLFMLDLYEKYPHPYAVREIEEKSFIEDVEEMAKKRGHSIGFRVGSELYALAKNTIPTRPQNQYTQLAVTTCVNSLRTLEKATEDIIAQMDELAKKLPEYDVVGKMGGIGRKLRPKIIAEIGDIRKYKQAGSLIAIAGLDTPPYQSGNFKADNIHISKRGNKYLRKYGYEIMQCIKSSKPTKDAVVYEYIVKKENEGKPPKVCKIAGLNKFLRIYYARVTEIYQEI